MKKIKLICSVLLLLCMIFPLASCAVDPVDPSNDTTTVADAPELPPLDVIVDGKSSFVIIRPDNNNLKTESNLAVKLNTAIKAATGSFINVSTDWEKGKVYDYELCIGELTRNGQYYNVDPSGLAEDQFIVKVSGNRVIMVGKTAYGTAEAVNWFISSYLAVTDGSLKTLSIPSSLEHIGSFEIPTTLRIMTQNLLSGDDEYKNCTTVDVSQHTLVKRQPRILSLIETYAPDSLGVQECSSPWRQYFSEALDNIGYARVGANKNQKIGIIYNTSTVKVIANGSFWLTEKPENLKLTVEWAEGKTNLIERLAMYVVFEHIATGQRYIHFNAHVETAKNSIIQTKQTEVILEYIDKIREKYDGIPVVVTGDFNYTSDSAAYKTLMSTILCDTRDESATSSGNGSFNKFIGPNHHSKAIDQILASRDDLIFNNYKVIYDKFDGNYASDHYAVLADIEIKK